MLPFIFDHLARLVLRKYNPSLRGGVLYFHRVLSAPDPYYPDDPTVDGLDAMLSALGCMFEFSSLSDMQKPPTGNKPRLGLSFDDGYRDNLVLGVPILKKHRAPATFFVASKGVKEGVLWQDRVVHAVRNASEKRQHNWCERESLEPLHGVALAMSILKQLKRMPCKVRDRWVSSICVALDSSPPPWLMLTQQDLRAINTDPSGLFQIGGHTCDHTILTTETDDEARRQIVFNKQELESWLGSPISLFCYPNGAVPADLSVMHAEMVRDAGYTHAFTTMDGGVDGEQDPFLLPRFLPYQKNPWLRSLSALKIAGEHHL